ncbi:hypothetical protein Moror_4716 [Moniliophthora roreri MCA 2997]|uniref:Mitochondrial adapter protein MCP1 transmembrane domain-containing protein n=1 Tax=Moniliophthora roreri (strain MCA 2997) TaxID=1381753 RepID=V2YKH8_MONRO|nr:hypothetical protein Moror_4716 [Moniliophthora roreri MCA 2997]
MNDPRPYSTHIRTARNVLTTISHCSSPFISTFLLIHLSAPALANLGGADLGSSVMILGREYYQTPFGEAFLVLGPMALHSFSGIAKRKGAEQKSRRWPSLLASTAYPLIPLFTLHFMTHRGIPSSPSSPLHSSELDFEFVKFHLQTYPKLSWFLYGSLLALTLIHGVEGVVVVWNRYYPGLRLRQLGKAKWARIAAVLTGIGGTVISGLWFISREVPMVFPDMVSA